MLQLAAQDICPCHVRASSCGICVQSGHSSFCHPQVSYCVKLRMLPPLMTRSHRYSTGNIDDLFVHLTNASINKNVPDADDDAPAASSISGGDCKRLMSSVWALLQERGFNTARLWERICRILTATVAILVTKVPNVPEVSSGFELFGFDVCHSTAVTAHRCDLRQVLLDYECRPWLMEVNCSPALSMDGAVDTQVKMPLLKDTFQMVTLHTRTLKTQVASDLASGRSSAPLSKASSCVMSAKPIASARPAAPDLQKSARSLSAPRCLPCYTFFLIVGSRRRC